MSKSEDRRKEIQQESEEEKKARLVVEEIAMNIARLARQVTAILDGRLKRKTILILLSANTGLPQRTVDQVLTAIADMESTNLK